MVRKILIAVVLLAIVGGGAYFLMNKKTVDVSAVEQGSSEAAVAPATDGAAKGATDTAAAPNEFWTKRCNPDGDKYCEVFQRLMMKENNQRLIEFAVGFPKGVEGAQAAIILPLGVVVTDGILLSIDDQAPAKAAYRGCSQAGCFVVMNLPEAFLSSMKAGTKLTVSFLDGAGKKVNIEMNLKGFAEKLSEVKA